MTANVRQKILLNPLYKEFGVDAVLQPGDGDSEQCTVRVIDETTGVMLGTGAKFGVGTIKPAAAIRSAELVENDLTNDKVDGGLITFNGNTWHIDAVRPAPSLVGERDGEIFLILSLER